MKENGFKFKESYANSIKAMNDKQAGKFIKFLFMISICISLCLPQARGNTWRTSSL